MRIQNLKKALLVCSVMSAASSVSWSSVRFLDITGTPAATTLLNPAVLFNTAATTAPAGALTGTLYTAATLAPAAAVVFNFANMLGGASGTPVELSIIKPGYPVTLDTTIATIWAPIKNPAGATIAITTPATAGAKTLLGAVSSVLPDGLTATNTAVTGYGGVYPQYCPATGNGSTYYPSGLIDASKSMNLDLSGLSVANTVSFTTTLGLVVGAGETLTITLPTYTTAGSTNPGQDAFAINLNGFLSGSGNIIINGAGAVTFGGDSSLWSGTILNNSTHATVTSPTSSAFLSVNPVYSDGSLPSSTVLTSDQDKILTTALAGKAYSTATLSTTKSTTFNVVNALGGTGTAVELDIVKSGQVNIPGVAANIHAPIKNYSGATIALTGASLSPLTASTVYPDGLTSSTYPTAYPQYCPAGTVAPTGLIDAIDSMILDLTGITGASYALPLSLVVEEGQTLTIQLPSTYSAVSAATVGNNAFPISFTGFLSGSGNIIVKGYGKADFSGITNTSKWTGSISLSSTNATDYTDAAVPATVILPALQFTSNAYTSDLSIAENTSQYVNLTGADAIIGYIISGKISGAGNLLVANGTAQRALHLTADNSGWTGGLTLGNGTLAYGPAIHVDHATGLGAASATGAITVSAGLTSTVPTIVFNTSATTARTIDLSASTNTTAALDIDNRLGNTVILNGVVSGVGTVVGAHGLRVKNDGTTKLMAANTHSTADNTSYATYITEGAKVAMGTVTSLGYHATANRSNVLIDENSSLTVPDTTGTIANPVRLNGNVTVSAPTTPANTITFSGTISGDAGKMIHGAGLGILNFTGTNTYALGFSVPSGLTSGSQTVPVTIGNAAAFGTGPVTTASASAFKFGGAFNFAPSSLTATAATSFNADTYDATITADMAGTGAYTKTSSTGSLTLAPRTGNTFTNPFVNAGGKVVMAGTGKVFGATEKVTLSSSTSAVQSPSGSLTTNGGTTAITVIATRS